MRKEIDSKSVKLDNQIGNDIEQIMHDNKENMTPFMELFWNEQKKLTTEK